MSQQTLIEEGKTEKSAEKALRSLLKRHNLGGKLTVPMIKDWVWNEKGSPMEAYNGFQKKCARYLRRIKDDDEFFEAMQIVSDAWNFFPHKTLGGKSPDQVMRAHLKKAPKCGVHGRSDESSEMPKVIVGGREMSWEEYVAMLEMMERLQIPFKRWIKREIMPKYRKYLAATLSGRTVEKHLDVAEMFFKRVWHVGFIEFDEIRKNFIQEEFPRWWQTHVLFRDLSEKEVLSSLRKLFDFICFITERDAKKFGF